MIGRGITIIPEALSAAERERLTVCRDAALAFANRVIIENGGEAQNDLVPGVPGDTMHCSLAETFDRALGERTALVKHVESRLFVNHNFAAYEHPDEVAEFSAYFDSGAYPDLVEAE